MLHLKHLLTFLVVINTQFYLKAQLPEGSVAPNFEVQDLDGTTWELQTLLEDGKTVVLDIYATYSGVSMDAHNLGNVTNAYNLFGPNGTDEIVVLKIDNGLDEDINNIYDTPWFEENWIDIVSYPIVFNSGIFDLYECSAEPYLFVICSDGIIQQSTSPFTADITPCSEYDNGEVLLFYENTITINCNDPLPTEGIEISGGTPPYDIDFLNTMVTGGCLYNYVQDISVTDQAGYVVTAQRIITVEDTEAPVFNESFYAQTVQGTPNYQMPSASVFAQVEVYDVCDDFVLDQSIPENTILTPGQYTIALEAIDGCANLSSATLFLTVLDDEDPLFNISIPDNNSVECLSDLPEFSYELGPGFSENAIVVEELFINDKECPISYTYIVSVNDPNSIESSAFCQILVNDTLAPTISDCPSNLTIAPNSLGQYLVPNLLDFVTISDNCEAPISFVQNPEPNTVLSFNETPLIFFATDQCGNLTSCFVQLDLALDNSILAAPDGWQAPRIIRETDNCTLYFNEGHEYIEIFVYDITGKLLHDETLSKRNVYTFQTHTHSPLFIAVLLDNKGNKFTIRL